MILGERADQDDVIKSIYKETNSSYFGLKGEGWLPARTGFIAYGSTGSGKTYTMSGDPWEHDGIIQKFLEKLARDMKDEMAEVQSSWSVSMSMI